ncbi:FecCD family ABC transporter permease [Solimicrobium silvestre]|uniref:ABC-type Fe3+-siderophore transport system permease component n=1 Tax=Solimicrobium silvestre TaxID=2099400 RepID=A0A2S9GUW1_9BURK|nr:iron ABC transporter permease [Solimicrobium silvestre]PRC91522.1 ABC-type Fe3+-siderophore transport system permease component [Solimicrobium silvestre]
MSIPFNQSSRRAQLILASLLLASLFSLALACCVGSVSLSFSELLHAVVELLQGAPSSLSATLFELRLHRALSAFVTGGSLALAGVLMQALLRNPLADPYVLGISGGAAVGALTAILLCGAAWMVDLAAFGGAVAVSGLLFLLAYKDFKGSGSSEGSTPTLLLTGVIVSSGCLALITLFLSISPDSRLRSMVFWVIGDLSGAEVRYTPWIVMLGILAYVCNMARVINVAALYADSASTLGISVGRLRKILFFCAALLTASAVSSAGSIGFVGLIMPHACRFAWGPDHRLLLPASCIAGGCFLVLADTIARSLIAPMQLPVGVITSLIGVPLFLVQLHQHRRHQVK